MTDRYDQDRVLGNDAIIQEIKQFRRLEPFGLPDDEMAHRMAVTVREVSQIRHLIGRGRVRLYSLNIPYHARFLLGTQRVKTIGKLLSMTDKELLAIKGLGPKTLRKLKECICEYMEKQNG